MPVNPQLKKQLGKIIEACVATSLPTGCWLDIQDLSRSDAENNNAEPFQVFLPAEHYDIKPADNSTIRVFVTVDKDRQIVADARLPLSKLNEPIVLIAKDVTEQGAFFNWGTSRDLYIPRKWQEEPINPGMEYVVVPFVDEKNQRIVGATKLKHFFPETNTWLKPNQNVSLIAFAKTQLGYKMLIDNTTLGLLFHSDVHAKIKIGERINGAIKEIREDGKINLTLSPINKTARKSLSESILEDLKAHDGLSTLTDKSSPEDIFERFQVSKGAYKKALGQLYKSKKIDIKGATVRLI